MGHSSAEYLEKALSSSSCTPQDSVSTLVAYCEGAAPVDASEILNNIIRDNAQHVIAEYLCRRLDASQPNSIDDSAGKPMISYRKPEVSIAKGSTGKNQKKASKSRQILQTNDHSARGKHERLQIDRQSKDARTKKEDHKEESDDTSAKPLQNFRHSEPCNCQARWHKLVNNCLSCGKIVCEQEGEGPCSFCGAEVWGNDHHPMHFRGSSGGISEGEVTANMLKNKLLAYDRSGHLQTTVIDDQSGCFDIDGNAWMSHEEKIKLQRKELEEAEKVHQNRTVLLLDLAGGKVSVALEDDAQQSNVPSHVIPVKKQFPNPRIMANSNITECPVYVDVVKSAQQIQCRKTKIPDSMMVRSGRVQHDDQFIEVPNFQSSVGRPGFTSYADEKTSNSSLGTEKGSYREISAAVILHPMEHGMDVRSTTGSLPAHRSDDSLSSEFDICIAKNKARSGGNEPIKLSSSLYVQTRENKRNTEDHRQNSLKIEDLMPGMSLLKNWLSQNDQVEIVKICRTLGVGQGGFYQPGYGDRSKMHLWMMCLGKNWDPSSKSYEDIRPYDNAVPPPLPKHFISLVDQAIQEAHNVLKSDSKLKGSNVQKVLPSMHPDVCIVNFYKESGKLGLHQDKDESRSSIERGLPVVSFSIGDSADFVYGTERDVEKAKRITLESGDVLIFGGESRLIFHGITHVHPHTTPNWLSEQTNLRPGRLNLTFRQL